MSPNQAKINTNIRGMYGGVGYPGSLWEMGAKSLELRSGIGRGFREPSAWPWRGKRAAVQIQQWCLQESTYQTIPVWNKKGTYISVRRKCYKQIYTADVWNKLLVMERCLWHGANSESWNYPPVPEWLLSCVGTLRSRPWLSPHLPVCI